MKKICLLLALLMLLPIALSACAPALQEPAVSTEAKTEEKKTEENKPAKKTEEEKKEETAEPAIMQEYDPKEDDEINLLMIGNSFCYYFVEELYGVANAAGVNLKVYNLYYSGCKLSQHWTWWKQGESNYQLFKTDASGRKLSLKSAGLTQALSRENWDMISIQESSAMFRNSKTPEELEDQKTKSYKYLTDLLGYIRQQFPLSTYYWHHIWAYQVGYNRNGFVVDTVQKQTEMWENARDFHLSVSKEFNLIRVPSGDAWQYARQDARAGDVLCNRGDKSDNYHDGDEGGGQYLNACVWLETLTGKSCIGNTWRPDTYTLSEAKIAALQEAAHRAVAESRI